MKKEIKSIESFQGGEAVITIEGDISYTSDKFESLLDNAFEYNHKVSLGLLKHGEEWEDVIKDPCAKERVIEMLNDYFEVAPNEWNKYFTLWVDSDINKSIHDGFAAYDALKEDVLERIKEGNTDYEAMEKIYEDMIDIDTSVRYSLSALRISKETKMLLDHHINASLVAVTKP